MFVRQCASGSGEGQHTVTSGHVRLSGAEREQASNHTHRVGAQCLCAHERSSTPEGHHGRARWPGSPIVTP